MPECQNCGAHVTDDYVRVREPAHRETARTCPNCDLVRDGPHVREATFKRVKSQTGGAD